MRHHALCERAKARTTAEQLMGAWGKFPVRSVARVHRVVPLRASRPRSRGACHVKPFEGGYPSLVALGHQVVHNGRAWHHDPSLMLWYPFIIHEMCYGARAKERVHTAP